MLESINYLLNVLGLILMAAVSVILMMIGYELFTWRLQKAKFGRRIGELNSRLLKLELFQALDNPKPLQKKDNFKKTGAAQVSKAQRVSPKTSKRPLVSFVRATR